MKQNSKTTQEIKKQSIKDESVNSSLPLASLKVVEEDYHADKVLYNLELNQVSKMFRFVKKPTPKVNPLTNRLSTNGLNLGAAADDVPSLDDILGNATKAPGTTTVVALPTTADGTTVDMKYISMLKNIRTLESFASVYGATIMYKENPKGWDITDPKQASDFTRKLANMRNLMFTNYLSSFVTIESTTAQSFSKSTTSADLHLEFLG
jgi:hypothetical protein